MNINESHWFWGAVKSQKSQYIQVIIASIFINIFALVSAFYVMTVYDRVIPNDARESLLALTLGVLIIIFFDFVMKSLRGSFTDKAGSAIDKTVGERLFDHLARNYNLVSQRQVGAVSSTVREFEQLKEFISSASFTAFVDFPFILLFVFVLWNLGGPIAVVPGVIVLAVIAVSLGVQPLIRKVAQQGMVENQSKQGVLVELLTGMETAKTLPGLGVLRDRWLGSVERQSTQTTRSKGFSLLATNAAQTGQQLCQVGVVAYGVLLIAEGSLTMGSLIACVILGGRTLAPLAQITGLINRYSQAKSAYQALDQMFQVEDREEQAQEFIRRADCNGALEFRSTSLAYPKAGRPALDSVDLAIAPGQKMGGVGPIGSGKTSLLRIASGLIEPTSGQVLVGGIDVTHWHPDDLRQQVGIITQTPTLFTGTVAENIRLGNPGASDEEVIAAAEMAGVGDFVNQLENGLDTHLFERGAQLSGGQRQAICIARAVVGDPKILIMDEPTSSLDNASEQRLVERLAPWVKERTLVVITHRAPMLALVSDIAVIEAGKITSIQPKSKVIKSA